ncbi:MAG: hypothetical protein ACW98Y_21360, partial [Candidatus Thorarchaeota archaeon]
MKPEDLEQRLRNMPEILRIYTDQTYKVAEKILRRYTINRVLDFSAIPQSFIFPLAEKFNPTLSIAIPTRISHRGYGNLIEHALRVPKASDYWRMENQWTDTGVIWMDYDSHPEDSKYDLVLGVLENQSDLEHALRFVDKGGIALFHVHTFFFRNIHQSGPFGELAYYIQSALANPTGLMANYYEEQFADEYLIILETTRTSDIFLGYITEDGKKNRELSENMRARKAGRTIKSGFLTNTRYLALDEGKYWWQAYNVSPQANREMPHLETGGKLGFSHRVYEVVVDIQFSDSPQKSELGTNVFIIALPASDTIGEGYVHVLLDESQILVDYFELYIEEGLKQWEVFIITQEDREKGRFGRFLKYGKWLDRCTTKDEILHRILNTYILIPEISLQSEMIRLSRKLENISAHLGLLRNRMWSEPKSHQAVEMDLDVLGKLDTFPVWLSVLPFPLASILHSYRTTMNVKDRIDDAFYFFEILTQFMAIILLSAISSHIESFNKIMKQVSLDEFSEASMGNWMHLGNKLGQYIIKQLKHKETRNLIISMFGGASEESIYICCSSELWKTLRKA